MNLSSTDNRMYAIPLEACIFREMAFLSVLEYVLKLTISNSSDNSRVGGVQMQIGEQRAEIQQTDFLMYFHFYACLLRKMEYNIVRGS